MSDKYPPSASSEKESSPMDTMERYVDGKLEVDTVKPDSRRGNSTAPRNLSVATDNGRQYSTGGPRRQSQWDAMKIAKEGGVEIDEEIELLEEELRNNPVPHSIFAPVINFKNPAHFTYLLVGFASMGGLLSGIDQSLISGANLYMPASLHLDTSQVSLVASGVPLGAIGGALLLGPTNEAVGRRMAIIISLILYTVGAALEAGAINFGMMVAGRVILGLGVGLEGGTVPVYVAESVARKYRGNLVSLYQFNIALGEVFGYVVAAIFVNVKVIGSLIHTLYSLTTVLERQLALHARLLPYLLHRHVGRHVLHARIAPLPHAQGPHPRSIQCLEAHPRNRAPGKPGRILRHETLRPRRARVHRDPLRRLRLARLHHRPSCSPLHRLRQHHDLFGTIHRY